MWKQSWHVINDANIIVEQNVLEGEQKDSDTKYASVYFRLSASIQKWVTGHQTAQKLTDVLWDQQKQVPLHNNQK